jgi:hypothetical protein
VRKNTPSDPLTNKTLAEIYGERYWHTRKSEFRLHSEQAIDRVLNSSAATREDRAKMLTMRGDNKLADWRLDLMNWRSSEERRLHGINRIIRDAYDTYHEAFLMDPAYISSGVSALKVGKILIQLSEEETWQDAFDDDDEASAFKQKIEEQIPMLHQFSKSYIIKELRSDNLNPHEKVSALITNAEILFLDNARDSRVKRAYQDAIPGYEAVGHWISARRQLKLYADLDIRKELSEQIIGLMEDRFPQQFTEKPLHIVLIAAPRVSDCPLKLDEEQTKEVIRKALENLRNQGYLLKGLASASPGTDILFHEVCTELKVDSTICLPIGASHYAKEVFKDLDNWRTKFLSLKAEHDKRLLLLELSKGSKVPKWLHNTSTDKWERGNRWLLSMATTSKAEKVTLFTIKYDHVVDSDPESVTPTEAMARELGTIYIEPLKIETN